MRPLRAAALALALVGCGPEPVAPPCDRASVAAASAPDRRLLGVASEVPADPTLEARWSELAASQRERRRVAWEAAARVLTPVALAEPTPLGEASVPRFRTFYDREDFFRIFQHLYEGLTPEERAARARFSRADLDDAFVYDVGFLDTLGTWTPERWATYVASFDTSEAVASIGGVRRIATSPAMTRHLANSYPEILRCLAEGAPPSEVPVAPRTDTMMHRPLVLAPCDVETLGPFTVERTAQLAVALSSDGADPVDATLEVLEGSAIASATSVCTGSEPCEVAGPGSFFVRVSSERAATVVVDVTRTVVAPPIACLDGALPIDAVSVATEWRRLDPSLPFPVYDTSADRLRTLLAASEPTWGSGEGTATPGPDEIYTQRLPDGETYVLAAMHVRTRELPLGLDLTLWWSDTPDEDFGADRPASFARLGGPWSHYKMCVAVEHTELDPLADGGFEADAPSLAAALAAVSEGRGGPTWCSNPYIDGAPGLARGNCVGCHQHAMSGVRPGEIATDPVHYPSSGRLAARNNYPSDGFWGLDAGDSLAAVVQQVVDYWQ